MELLSVGATARLRGLVGCPCQCLLPRLPHARFCTPARLLIPHTPHLSDEARPTLQPPLHA